MSPIRISPEIPAFISEEECTLCEKPPSMKPTTASSEKYCLPADKPLDCIVKVIGFHDSPGGILISERLTPGHSKDQLMLTTREDSELNKELGLSLVRIDGVIYEATDPA